MRPNDRLFILAFGSLLVLAAAPFWLTRLLPMQDYPQTLLLAQAYGDCLDPTSPFFGTYARGFTFSPSTIHVNDVVFFNASPSSASPGRTITFDEIPHGLTRLARGEVVGRLVAKIAD